MLIEKIRHWASTRPDKIAAVLNDQPISYARFWRYLQQTLAFLDGEALPKGSVAAILISNIFYAWLVGIALRARGLHTVAIASAAQIRTLDIRTISCVVVLQTADAPPAELGALPPSISVITLPETIYLRATGSVELSGDGRHYGGHILNTSGTTGSYKSILFDSVQEDARNVLRAENLGVTETSVFHGLNFGLWTGAGYKQPSALWHVGGTMIFDQRPDFLENLARHGVTATSLLPPMYRQLLAIHGEPDGPPPLAHIKLNASSGFLPLPLAENVIRKLSPELIILYSATEMIRTPFGRLFRDKEDIHWMDIWDGQHAEIVTEDDRPCAIGEEGFLRILRHDLDAQGYLDNAAASADVFRAGYFYPGDMAVLRADGRIRILGRISDVINIQGAKVAVAPIEQHIQRQLGAEDVCIFAHHNALSQEEILIAVQSAAPIGKDRMNQVAREFSASLVVRFVVLKQFPRTDMGTQKVRRLALKNALLGKAGIDRPAS